MEAENWKLALGRSLNFKYKNILDDIVQFVADYSRRLSHPIKDLEDVRFAMSALSDIRKNEIRIDMSLGPVEVLCILFLGFSTVILLITPVKCVSNLNRPSVWSIFILKIQMLIQMLILYLIIFLTLI